MFFDGASYSSVVFAVLEAPAEALEAFLTGEVAELLEQARVVCFSDDLAARAWPVLGTAAVSASTT